MQTGPSSGRSGQNFTVWSYSRNVLYFANTIYGSLLVLFKSNRSLRGEKAFRSLHILYYMVFFSLFIQRGRRANNFFSLVGQNNIKAVISYSYRIYSQLKFDVGAEKFACYFEISLNWNWTFYSFRKSLLNFLTTGILYIPTGF